MKDLLFYAPVRAPALGYAIARLQENGCPFTQLPDPAVTHILLPVPSADTAALADIPGPVTVIGGKLPALTGHRVIDLLKDPQYVSENAAITAHCALQLAMTHLPVCLPQCPTLIIGWGRIGKCLAGLLKAMDAPVSVFARKEADRAMLTALGYQATDRLCPESYRLIFNTAPELLLPQCRGDALKIDLASSAGITGPDVLWARGLPGKLAPESAGALMAKRILYHINKEETP